MSQTPYRYGQVQGEEITIGRVPIANAQKFHQQGGGFVFLDSSGHATLALTATTQVKGWLVPEFGDTTKTSAGVYTSGAAGVSFGLLFLAHSTAIFRIPSDAAVTIAAMRFGCDLIGVNDGTTQKADIGAHTNNVLDIVRVGQENIDQQDVQVRVNVFQTDAE